MFDRVIKDPDWRAALHGRPIMRAEYAGEVFFICPAKAIHAIWGQNTERGNNPYNLALMIKHHRSWDAWKSLPWFAVCDAEERELFCIQSPAGDNAIGRMMLESRVRWILKIRKEGVIPWLQPGRIECVRLARLPGIYPGRIKKPRRENAAGQCHRKNKAPGDSKNRGPFS